MGKPAPDSGTLLIAALLLLVLGFAGVWIIEYVQPGSNPWKIVPWFMIAAGVIIVVGLLGIIGRSWRS